MARWSQLVRRFKADSGWTSVSRDANRVPPLDDGGGPAHQFIFGEYSIQQYWPSDENRLPTWLRRNRKSTVRYLTIGFEKVRQSHKPFFSVKPTHQHHERPFSSSAIDLLLPPWLNNIDRVPARRPPCRNRGYSYSRSTRRRRFSQIIIEMQTS